MDKVLNFLSISPSASYTITGTYSYYLEVSIKGDSPYQTSTISLTAFTKSDKKIAIAISCKWYRVLSDRQYRLATIHSNAYQLSAEDLGSTLKIEVTPQEEDQKGTAIVQYGPIRLDPNVRNTLESILGAGGSRFPVQIVDEETGLISREPAALSLTSEYIRIVETPSVGKEKEVKFRYNYDNPKVELNYLDATRLYFMFDGEEDDCEAVRKFLNVKKGTGCKLGAKFLSRTARDLIMLTIKCFATKNYLVNSMLINEVVFCPGKIFKDKKETPQQIGDTILEVDSIKREMYLVMLRNQELNKDKERLQISVKNLEGELSSTIETYSQLINEVRTNSDASQTTEGAGEYRKRAENLEEEVKKLRRRVQEMEDDKILESQSDEKKEKSVRKTIGKKDNDELANIRQDFERLSVKKEDPNMFSLEYEMKLHDLEEENERLRAKNDSLLEDLRQARERGSVQPDTGRGTKGRMSVAADESFSVIENKLSDTKKLNELLIKQVNDQKAKNNSLHKELDMLRGEVSNLREGNDNEQQVKERLYKQEKEALEKELQRLTEENRKFQRERGQIQANNLSANEKNRYESQVIELSRKIEALQKENKELQASNFSPNERNRYEGQAIELSRKIEALQKENKELQANSLSTNERSRYEGQAIELSRKIESLYKENMELKEKATMLERHQMQATMGMDPRGYNSVNISQSGSLFSTPVKRVGESFDIGRDRGVMNEELVMRVRNDLDAVSRDAMNWKGRCTSLEIELEKLRRENTEMRIKTAQMSSTLNSSGALSSGNSEFISFVDKSVLNTSRTYEALLADSKRENDRLYGEVTALKNRLVTTEFNLQSAKGDLERARGSMNTQFGIENELSKARRDADLFKEETDRLKVEIGSLRMSASKLINVEERDRITRERDELRGEVESLKKTKASQVDFEEKIREAEWKLNEKTREVEALKTQLENYQTKNGSLLKEIDYLRDEIKNMKKTEESLFVDSGYKAKYEQLGEQYNKLDKELKVLRSAASKANEDKENYEDLQQMNELLRKEVLEYKKRAGDVEQGRMSARDTNIMANPADEELKKRNKSLEVEMQNQRSRISDLEKENERLRLVGSTRESTHDESFIMGKDDDNKKLKVDMEKLQNENESLLLQRTQLSKRVESLVKELESKVNVKTNQAMLENFARTNEKLIQENARLMEELESARSDNSRLDCSRYEDNDRERVRELQQDLFAVTSERDQLLVQVSKMKALEKNKGIFK